jgi:hypothetical protein
VDRHVLVGNSKSNQFKFACLSVALTVGGSGCGFFFPDIRSFKVRWTFDLIVAHMHTAILNSIVFDYHMLKGLVGHSFILCV